LLYAVHDATPPDWYVGRPARRLVLTIGLAIFVGACSLHPTATGLITPDGVVRFGTTNPGPDCNHSPFSNEFPPESQIYWWAGFRDPLPGGVTVVEEASFNGEVFETSTHTMPAGGGDCMTRTRPTGGVIAGTWTVRILWGDKVEAEGSFTVP
jgi:hypothetical protein